MKFDKNIIQINILIIIVTFVNHICAEFEDDHAITLKLKNDSLLSKLLGLEKRLEFEFTFKYFLAYKHRYPRYSDNISCGKRKRNIENRLCLRQCKVDADCRGAKKRCLCDGDCGLSCVKVGKLIGICFYCVFIFIFLFSRPIVQ